MRKLKIWVFFICVFGLFNGQAAESLSSYTSASEEPAVQQKINDLAEQLLVTKQQIRGTTVVWSVGLGAGCNFNTIQAAINAANNNNDYELRVANNKTYHENLRIDHPNMTLQGGFADCVQANANNSNGQQVFLIGDNNTAPVIVFENSGTGSRNEYQLSLFDIAEGTGVMDEPAGGINVLDNLIDLTVDDVLIHNNTGLTGGGLYVEGNNTDLILIDSLFILNAAINGGAIYCDGADVLLSGLSGVALNEATGTVFNGNGGGLYLTNACVFNMFAGTSGGVFDFRGIAGNKANRNGGGVFADTGADLNLWGNLVIGPYGNTDQPVNITGNEANLAGSVGQGGGIYAVDDGTQISAYATIINNNVVKAGTTSSAGAAYLGSGAGMSLSRLNAPCWDAYQCNQIKNNQVTGDNSSYAGILALNSVDLEIKNTWISGHSSSTVAFMFAQASEVLLEGNVFTDNGDDTAGWNASLISYWNTHSSGVTMAFNTFVNNQVDHVFRVAQNQALRLYSSVIQEAAGIDVLSVAAGSSPVVDFNCLMVHENTSFSGTATVIDDPLFVDAANEDFRLLSTSPAIDYCGNSTFSPSTRDVDYQLRGWDNILVADTLGPYDLGADEYYPPTTADIQLNLTMTTPGPYYVGQEVTFALEVFNDGPDTATDVSLARSIQNLNITAVTGAGCSSLPCTIPSINNAVTEVVNVTTRVNGLGNFNLSVSGAPIDYDDNLGNNNDSAGGNATEEFANIEITDNFSVLPPYHSGQVFNFQINVFNQGPDTARQVEVSFIGSQSTLLAVNSTHCNALPCTIDELPSQSSEVLDVTVQIVTGGSFNWSFRAFSDSTDGDLTNNSVGQSGIAQNTGDLEVVTTLLEPPAYVENQVINFDVVVKNLGPNVIGSIEVAGDLGNTSIVSVSGACSTLPCDPGNIDSGAQVAFSVVATINSPGIFNLNIQALSSNSFDPDLSNNSSAGGGVANSDQDIIFIDSFE